MKIVAIRCLLAVSMMNLVACNGSQKRKEGTTIVDKEETPVTEVVEAPSSTPNTTDTANTANTANTADNVGTESINPPQTTTTPPPPETSFDASIAQATVDQIMATKKTVLEKDFTSFDVEPFNKNKYQIFAFLGCSTLSYYNYSYFDFKKTSDDPDGHNNLDIVTTTVENYIRRGSAQSQALLGAILGPIFDGEDRSSWQNIVAEMDQPTGNHRAIIAVSGDQPLD